MDALLDCSLLDLFSSGFRAPDLDRLFVYVERDVIFMSLLLFRRPKESHRDTIAYEIEMLQFSAGKLLSATLRSEQEEWMHLEVFLLHFRNIIRVLSGENHRHDDISTAAAYLWAGRDLSPEEIEQIQKPAIELDRKFFTEISKYLQHCTTLRSDAGKSWDVRGMAAEINPLITAFERSFPA
jgi:hypothetical protein